MANRSYTWNAYETALTATLGAGVTTAAVGDTSDLTAPTYLVIDPDNPLKREWVRVLALSAGSINNMDRGLTGSNGIAGVGVEHAPGTVMRVVYTKQVQDDLFTDIATNETDIAALNAALFNHATDQTDPHSDAGYVKNDEATPFLRLDGTSLPTAAIPMAGFKLTGLGAPSVETDASTKKYVDDQVAGTLSEPLVLQQTLTLSTIKARVNDIVFNNVSAVELLRWDESQNRWEFKKTVDMGGNFFIGVPNPTNAGHVGDMGFNDGRYLGKTAAAVSAGKWTTARLLTTTLAGDLTGSASMSVDGAANRTVTITAVVKNDSHTHDTRYLRLTGGVLSSTLMLAAGTNANTSLRFAGMGANDGFYGSATEINMGFNGFRTISVFDDSGQNQVQIRGNALVPLYITRQGSSAETQIMLRTQAGTGNEVALTQRALRWLADNHN